MPKRTVRDEELSDTPTPRLRGVYHFSGALVPSEDPKSSTDTAVSPKRETRKTRLELLPFLAKSITSSVTVVDNARRLFCFGYFELTKPEFGKGVDTDREYNIVLHKVDAGSVTHHVNN